MGRFTVNGRHILIDGTGADGTGLGNFYTGRQLLALVGVVPAATDEIPGLHHTLHRRGTEITYDDRIEVSDGDEFVLADRPAVAPPEATVRRTPAGRLMTADEIRDEDRHAGGRVPDSELTESERRDRAAGIRPDGRDRMGRTLAEREAAHAKERAAGRTQAQIDADEERHAAGIDRDIDRDIDHDGDVEVRHDEERTPSPTTSFPSGPTTSDRRPAPPPPATPPTDPARHRRQPSDE